MLAKLPLFVGGLGLAIGLLQTGVAAEKATVTGCLAQGDHANEYAIKAQDGKTYGLHSSAVKLAEHMGQQVEVTGNVTEKKEKSGKEAKTGKPEEDAHMTVTSLKMISATCQ